MQYSFTRCIAKVLLACFSLVFIHAVTPHSHFEDEPETIDHHHDTDGNSHSHSGLTGILDFLNDLTHSEIGENHLEEYLSSSKQIVPLNINDVTGCDISNTVTQVVFQSDGFNFVKPVDVPLHHRFIKNSPWRGPPSQS
jgi:hypothetical protein